MKKLKELARVKEKAREKGDEKAKEADGKDKSARKQQRLLEEMAKELREKEAALEYERQVLERERLKLETRVRLQYDHYRTVATATHARTTAHALPSRSPGRMARPARTY